MHSHCLTLAPVFQDHAVLQREVTIPVWGSAAPNTIVHIVLNNNVRAQTRSNADGSWFTRLPAQNAGGPYTLNVNADNHNSITLEDILIGDVWICSGQSNMDYQLRLLDNSGIQSKGVNLPNVRLLTVATPAHADRQAEVTGTWRQATPESIANFSAVGGWFGRTIHEALDVPVGLIANAWGGTRIQAWLSREALMTDPAGRREVAHYETMLYGHRPMPELIYTSADEWFQKEGPETPTNLGFESGWHQPDCDDRDWETMVLPQRWQDAGYDFNGIVWFRHTVELPKAWQGRAVELCLGCIDKHDQTYVNGQLVGAMGWEHHNSWCTPRKYTIPAELTAQQETLTIAVRVRSHLYHGGMTGPVAQMNLSSVETDTKPLSLAGAWRFQIEQNWGVLAPPTLDFQTQFPGGQNAPYTLFNSRLAPLIPYGIKGWLWYQGESNASEAALYERLLPLMISDWRRVWGQGELPFIQVQLANFGPAAACQPASDWAHLRAAQAAALRLPEVGMAVAIDVGEAEDIHPKDKKSVGYRLARWALNRVYGCEGLPSGPLLRRTESIGNGRVRLSFDYAEGLCTRDGKPVSTLFIAGSDSIFVEAHSRIVGEQLEVWHPEISVPHTVYYAWADNPEGCNLVNKDDLPAVPWATRV